MRIAHHYITLIMRLRQSDNNVTTNFGLNYKKKQLILDGRSIFLVEPYQTIKVKYVLLLTVNRFLLLHKHLENQERNGSRAPLMQ